MIAAYKRAVGGFVACCLFLLIFVGDAAAIKVGSSSGGIFGQTVITNGVIYTPFTTNRVKYVRHTQFLTAEQDTPHAYKQANAGSSYFRGFSYKCPGWYVTRAYSDNAGTNMLGYIRIYVAEEDKQGTNCDPIAKAPAKPPVENKAVNITHPNPIKVENQNMATKAPAQGSNAPKNNGYPEDVPPPKPKVVNPRFDEPEPGGPGAENPGGGTENPGGGTEEPEEPGEPKPENPRDGVDPRGPIPEESDPAWIEKYNSCINARVGNQYLISWPDGHGELGWYGIHCVTKIQFEAQGCTGLPCPSKGLGENYYIRAFNGGSIPTDPTDPTYPEEACEGPNDRCNYYEHLCEDGNDCEDYDFIQFDYPAEPLPEEGNEVACGVCAIFKCPGFDKFVGHLYDIVDFAVGDVEPPPIPNLPRPQMPNIFDILNDVEQRNIPKPTGQDGFGDAGYDADDIKLNAPEIPVRDDPTGGFNITNPMDTLPEDGNDAPRPTKDVEIPQDMYPGAGTNGNAQYPSGGNGNAEYPSGNGGNAKYPTGG